MEGAIPSLDGLVWSVGHPGNVSAWVPGPGELNYENLTTAKHAKTASGVAIYILDKLLSVFGWVDLGSNPAEPVTAVPDPDVEVTKSDSTMRYLTSRFFIALVIWAGTHAFQTLRRDAAQPKGRFPSNFVPRAGCWLCLSCGFFFIGLFSLGQAGLSRLLAIVYEGRPALAKGGHAGYKLTIFKRDSQEILDVSMAFWEREVGRALVGPHKADASVIPLLLLTLNWFFLAWPRAIFRSEAGYETFLREALDFWEDRLPIILRGRQRPVEKTV